MAMPEALTNSHTASSDLAKKPRLIRTLLVPSVLGLGGAIAAVLIWQINLQHYEAQISLPFSVDIGAYRVAEQNFHSPQDVERFGNARNLTNDPIFKKLKQQIDQDSSGPLKIDYEFRITKRDFRDVPEAIAKDIVRSPGASIALIKMTATARRRKDATDLANLSLAYLREILVKTQLKSYFQSWIYGSRTEIAFLRDTIDKASYDLSTVNYKIAAMQAIRDKYINEKDSINPGLQLQIVNPRNLPPLQQIIGLEADRAEAQNTIRVAQDNEVRLQTLVAFANDFAPRLDAGESPTEIARAMLARTASTGSKKGSQDPSMVDQAYSEVGLKLTRLFDNYIDAAPEPNVPFVSRSGPSRTKAILFGALIGVAIWFLFKYFRWVRLNRNIW